MIKLAVLQNEKLNIIKIQKIYFYNFRQIIL